MSGSDSPCPVCNQTMSEPQKIEVCKRCHQTLVASIAVSVASTGEFEVPALMEMLETEKPPMMSARPTGGCTWCGKDEAEVKKMLSRGHAHICNECVALCADIMQAELGEGWR